MPTRENSNQTTGQRRADGNDVSRKGLSEKRNLSESAVHNPVPGKDGKGGKDK